MGSRCLYLQITPVLLAAVDSPVESLDSAKFCDKSNFFWRRRGSSQQNRNTNIDSMMQTMTQPLKMPHQTITGKPRNCFGEPDSTGGHIRAVNVTDHWYKPSLKSFISSGPIRSQTNQNFSKFKLLEMNKWTMNSICHFLPISGYNRIQLEIQLNKARCIWIWILPTQIKYLAE